MNPSVTDIYTIMFTQSSWVYYSLVARLHRDNVPEYAGRDYYARYLLGELKNRQRSD